MGKRIVQRLFGTPLPVPLLQRRRHRPAYVFLDHIGGAIAIDRRTLRLLAATALTKPTPARR